MNKHCECMQNYEHMCTITLKKDSCLFNTQCKCTHTSSKHTTYSTLSHVNDKMKWLHQQFKCYLYLVKFYNDSNSTRQTLSPFSARKWNARKHAKNIKKTTLAQLLISLNVTINYFFLSHVCFLLLIDWPIFILHSRGSDSGAFILDKSSLPT